MLQHFPIFKIVRTEIRVNEGLQINYYVLHSRRREYVTYFLTLMRRNQSRTNSNQTKVQKFRVKQTNLNPRIENSAMEDNKKSCLVFELIHDKSTNI